MVSAVVTGLELGGKVGKIECAYDNTGKRTHESHYALDDRLVYYNICEYDGAGREI